MAAGLASSEEAGKGREGRPAFGGYLRLFVVLEALALGWLFICVLGAPVVAWFPFGVTGSVQVTRLSLLVLGLGASVSWMRGAARGADRSGFWDSSWPRFGFLCLFVLWVNLFMGNVRGESSWGMVGGNDQPQYFAQLHSWVFDRDLDFADEYAAMPGVAEFMRENHPGDPEHNVAPVGAAVLWLPFYLVAHGCVLVMRLVGVPFVPDGISAPYAAGVAFGSIFMSWMGCLMVHRALRGLFSGRTAFFATLIVAMGSPLLWYLTGEAWMSHGPSFFAAAVVLYAWQSTSGKRSWRGWAGLGASIGLAMLVRPSQAVLLFLPLADGVRFGRAGEKAPAVVLRLLVCMVSAGVVFSWQLVVWWMRSGAAAPPGNPMEWSHPAILSLLFSSRHGIVAWHPLLAFGFIGAPMLWKRSRPMAICLSAVLVLSLYVNASIASWWGGASFGMRRFVGVLPFLAPGIAAGGSWVVRAARARPAVPVAILLAGFFAHNYYLAVQYRDHWFHPEEPVSFEHVNANNLALMHHRFGHPFSIPANWFFAWEHQTSPAQYDLVAGQNPFTEEITLQGAILRPFLGKGWNTYERQSYEPDAKFMAARRSCTVLLPLEGDRGYEVEFVLTIPDRLPEDQPFAFGLNGDKVFQDVLPRHQTNCVKVRLPAESLRDGINTLHFEFAHLGSVPRRKHHPEGIEVRSARRIPYAGILSSLTIRPIGAEEESAGESSAPGS